MKKNKIMNGKKICPKCNLLKDLKDFALDKNASNGYSSHCKGCKKIYNQNYYIKTYKKFKQTHKKEINQKERKYLKNNPWISCYRDIKQRCNNSNHKSYKYYGERGIKCLITKEEIKQLWFRDKAYNMDRPSIDRIENDGHYEYSNCQFIEQTKNTEKMIKTLLRNKNGTFKKKYK